MTIGALTEAELDILRRHSDVLAEGGFCSDPSPFHADLVKRAFLRLVYLEERADLLKGEIAARDEEIARLREQVAAVDRSNAEMLRVERESVRKAESRERDQKARVAQLEAALRKIVADDDSGDGCGYTHEAYRIARAALEGAK